jgi:hypothetical protein
MCSLGWKRRIAPCPRRATEIDVGDGSKEDTMVPGITETECRIAEFRYRELHAEVDRQRRAASGAAVPASGARVMETIQRHIGAVMEQFSHLRQGVRTQEATDPAAAPGPLAVN